ncbi:demethylspheroidene O-methyltransferase [Rhodoblastus acidophilus]|uniref:Demethylspheroidene O-methyltransferase n=2 Tax=Rhodoblastus acidophilus TaxID=1074 RepID=A0A212S0U5_RHOAC|nr:acetylserotonin O-methyltransferase [Rhodoblastus acidophilus]SNB78604.1 demethylspheroidene O-methyltransferase [Rhodoblastus acidophilus]
MTGTNLPATIGPASVSEMLRHGRNLLIANPAFQKWAASFPLTRLIAERQSNALFDICSGFVYSQILLACVRLDLFSKLAGGPRPCAAVAEDLDLPFDATQRLLRAATALKLVDALEGERYGLGELGAALLANPSISSFVEHHALLYADLADPVALLRGETATKLSGFWPYANRKAGDPAPAGGEAYETYSDLMAQSQADIAEDILDAFPPTGRRRWVDIGGGEGVFASALAIVAPEVEAQLFDLPPVAARARSALQRRGMLSRVTVHEGDFVSGSLPKGADVMSLIRVLHDHDDETVRGLLARIHEALDPGGTLLIAEPMGGGAGSDRVSDAYFNFYLLAMGRGRTRSVAELTALLEAGGFSDVRVVPSRRPMLANVLVAQRV